MKRYVRRCLSLLLAGALFLSGCASAGGNKPQHHYFTMGFSAVSLPVPEDTEEPLYIAGYRNGYEITGVLDEQQARAVWLSDGKTATVLIAVDCVALGSDTVGEIRRRLANFCKKTHTDAGVNVVATHTHAGLDTLGLWGPMGLDGKNGDFMETVIAGAVQAAKEAYANRCTGTLSYGVTPTLGMQEDSRNPQVYDTNLYQVRFTPDDPANNGIRLIAFAAHAEAMRSRNSLVSRDYPGVMCDYIRERTGEDVLYVPGAIGGLIMTPVLTDTPLFDAAENSRITGERLGEYALGEIEWQTLEPYLRVSRVEFEVQMDNTLFMYYKFLGILQNPVRRTVDGRYLLSSELTLLQIGDVTLALLPGEVFPELVFGTETAEDPAGLAEIAASYGVENLMVIGLANDELGYVVSPSDFVLDEELPFVREAEGDHYEETNSVGSDCANVLAEAFEKALKAWG